MRAKKTGLSEKEQANWKIRLASRDRLNRECLERNMTQWELAEAVLDLLPEHPEIQNDVTGLYESSSTSDLHLAHPAAAPMSQKRSSDRARLYKKLDEILDSDVPALTAGIRANLESWSILARLVWEAKKNAKTPKGNDYWDERIQALFGRFTGSTRAIKKAPPRRGRSHRATGGGDENPPEGRPS